MSAKSHREQDNLKSFVSCLHYLSQEAQREQHDDIANILINAISEIEEVKSCTQNFSAQVLDRSIYYALDFLGKFSMLPKGKKQEVLGMLEQVA